MGGTPYARTTSGSREMGGSASKPQSSSVAMTRACHVGLWYASTTTARISTITHRTISMTMIHSS